MYFVEVGLKIHDFADQPQEIQANYANYIKHILFQRSFPTRLSNVIVLAYNCKSCNSAQFRTIPSNSSTIPSNSSTIPHNGIPEWGPYSQSQKNVDKIGNY